MKCPYCGSERIEREIAWGRSAETGSTGLKYKTDFYQTDGIAQIYSDLCLDCGTVIRSYIIGDTDKDWIHEPDSADSGRGFFW